MTQRTVNFLGLALDDYRAARLLLREGLLAPGAAVAATAVEKELKAALAMKGVFTKKHLDPSLLALAIRHLPDLAGKIDADFVKFLGKAFNLRYATIDAAGFGIVINQNRTLAELDATILTIDSGFRITQDGIAYTTPLQQALATNDPMIVVDNVPLKKISWGDFADRPNKMLELRVGAKLRTLLVTYQTEGLNIIGDFSKNTDMDFNKTQFTLARG